MAEFYAQTDKDCRVRQCTEGIIVNGSRFLVFERPTTKASTALHSAFFLTALKDGVARSDI